MDGVVINGKARPISGSKGKLFRAARPGYPLGEVGRRAVETTIEGWKDLGITHVVCLLTDGEQLYYYGRDLVRLYQKGGLVVLRFPVPDHKPMRVEFATRLAAQVAGILESKGSRVLVHCSAGCGRTSMALGCIASYMARQGPLRLVKDTGVPQTRAQVQVIAAVAAQEGTAGGE